MKSTKFTCIILTAVLAVLAAPIRTAAQDQKGQARYAVTNLGALGGTSAIANGINNKDWVTGGANLQGDQYAHAFLWTKHKGMQDLGTLGGPNSFVSWPVKDDRGLIAGQSDTSTPDPFNENFCGDGNGLTCLGFLWRDGTMTALPTLGGNNGVAGGVNNRGQVVGWAENSTQDPSCAPPQVLDWEAVVWGPKKGQIQELPPLSGDSIAGAIGINDNSQVVGCSGSCAPVSATACVHAVLWEDGSPSDLGNLGGAVGNVALGINEGGDVIGFSDLAGDTTSHAFLWTEDTGMQDLGTLSGDVSSAAFGINNNGQIVGQSCDASGNCRAFLWQNGVMTDLNTLVCPGTSLYLTNGGGADINDRGEIAGQAYDPNTGDTPAFLAVPSHGKGHCETGASAAQKIILPENVREQLRKRRGFGRFRLGQ